MRRRTQRRVRIHRGWLSGALGWLWALGLTALPASVGAAKEAQWIWSPAYEKEQAPQGTCYFRKRFELGQPENGTLQISCDDSYELYINGRQVGAGQNWKVLDTYDVTKYLLAGPNTIAVKAVNSEGGSAGLAVRLAVKEQGNTHIDHSSDGTWHTTLKEFPQWQKPRFDDSQWLAARSFGNLGSTLPWGNEVAMGNAESRFKVAEEFHVEWLLDPKETGSLICMTFDEFGQIIAARENGELIIIRDKDKDGLVDTVSVFSDEMKNCQGLLSISGKLYAVGTGPQGTALYRLSDDDHDGQADKVEAVLKFAGEMGEHGPHALTLGPDGLIYILLGNFSQSTAKYEDTSPYHDFYEGDLLLPRYEDASGHAVGIKAPGGTIIRTDTEGHAVELFAGGLQNPYDLAFNREGELFTCDSDMEWDSGMPWYRPTRVNHVSAGAEFGWRSGWMKWPNYFADSLPPTLELGRGSPAGMEVYDHYMFPTRYHNTLFVCDWSRGRILAVRTKPNGASYKATAEVFVEGQPLNCTDIAVGPDGWLYFCTGGRDTEGGIYRVVWDGKVPASVLNRGKGLAGVLSQPQLNSAWARQEVAVVKRQLGDAWQEELTDAAENVENTIGIRLRALELMQLFGPAPTSDLLVSISRDRSPLMRAKAAKLLGLHTDDESQDRLAALLDDRDLMVQRAACESLVRGGQPLPAKRLLRLLGSPDRYVSWAAGRALQQLPTDKWEEAALELPEARAFVNGSVALLAMKPQQETIVALLERCRQFMSAYLTDDEFVGMLRVIELACVKGEIDGDNVPELRKQLFEEYPARDPRMNRELARILIYLQHPDFAERLVDQLVSDTPSVERMQLLMHAHFLRTGWSTPMKLEVLRGFEEARAIQGGKSFAGYIEKAARDFFAAFDEDEQQLVLADGVKWPSSALSVLAKLPEHPSPETLATIQKMDRKVKRLDTEASKKLRIGICAVLGGSGDEKSMAYLRELFDEEPDRRVTIAMALAQKPEGENWPYLLRSLSIVEGAAAQEVLSKLAQVDRTTDEPEMLRQVIIRGLMLRESGGRRAADLLEKWTETKLTAPADPWDKTLAAWQNWFIEKYPELPEPKLPVDAEKNHWTYQELYSYLNGPQGSQGVPARGAVLFEKAQCIKCHRYGDRGDTVGPDLTNVSKRFQRKEILESILFPAQVISDQYATQTVVTKDGKSYTGMVAPRGDGSLVILQATGDQVIVAEQSIEQTVRNKTSAMPDGLLNTLSVEDIADLFAYLANPPGEAVVRRPARVR